MDVDLSLCIGSVNQPVRCFCPARQSGTREREIEIETERERTVFVLGENDTSSVTLHA
jgi:hypothetical protein